MLLLMLLLSATTQVDVELAFTDGATHSGRLESLGDEKAVIIQSQGRREFAWNTLRQIRFQNAAPPAAAVQRAILTDGTQLTITGFLSIGEQLTLQGNSAAAELTVPRRQLRAVRLMALQGAPDKTWREIAQSAPKSDVVVMMRTDQRLHAIEGVIGDIDAEFVKFQFNGEWVPVRRGRVAGLVYAVPANEQQGLPIGQLSLTDASEIQIQQMQLRDGQLHVTTPNGSQFSFALDRLHQVDLAATSTIYLSDIDPESMTVRPFVRIPALSDAHGRWYQPQRDQRLSHEPLVTTIEGTERSFAKGLGLHSHTELVYRLAGNFRRFMAWAAVDDTESQGSLELIILADGREVLRQAIRAGEEPRPIDVDLNGVNRMQIVVDYGDHGDVGDQMSLFDARFIK